MAVNRMDETERANQPNVSNMNLQFMRKPIKMDIVVAPVCAPRGSRCIGRSGEGQY